MRVVRWSLEINPASEQRSAWRPSCATASQTKNVTAQLLLKPGLPLIHESSVIARPEAETSRQENTTSFRRGEWQVYSEIDGH